MDWPRSRHKGLSRFVVNFCFFMILIAPIIWFNWPRPYNHPNIWSDAYVSPRGCTVKQYQNLDPIELACAEKRYAFDDWAAYGLQYPGGVGYHDGRKTGTYYRVGDDLVGFQCPFGQCSVLGVERRVFHRRPM